MPTAPAQRFRLGNGLQVLLVEDHSAPLVAVHVAYRVGAADDPDNRHGLAHLYEHLMYGGSANLPGAYLTHLTDAGAHDLNGRTTLDSTRYFETVHREALEFALFAESDRMGHLQDTLSGATLERQRQVVLNELRQYRERADGRMQEKIAQMSYGPDHPYRHGIIGVEADLGRISLDDAKQFGLRHYRPNNAVLALAGDLDLLQARELCEQYFGAIAARDGDPSVPDCGAPALAERRVMQSAGSLTKLHRVWNLPASSSWFDDQAAHVFAWLIEARLKQQHAILRPEVRYRGGRLGSQLQLSYGLANTDIEQQWSRLLDSGFSDREIDSARRHWTQQLARQTQSRQGIAALLIDSELLSSELTDDSQRISAGLLNGMLREHLTQAVFELEVQPMTKPAASAHRHRTVPTITMPATDADVASSLERHRLDNGLQLIVARRPGSTLMSARLIFDGGLGLESPLPMGTAQLSATLALSDIGADVVAEAHPDCLRIAWSGTRAAVHGKLGAIGAALNRAPDDADALTRFRDAQIAAIDNDMARAESAVQRLLPTTLFGSAARTAKGSPSTVAQISIEQVRAFHALQYRASQASLLLVGNPDIDEVAKLFKLQSSDAPTRIQPVNHGKAKASLAWIDMPGAAQALVTIAWPLPRCNAEQQMELQALDRLLVSRFSSVLNLRLREDLGWTYGVRSRISDSATARHYEIQTWVPPQRALDTQAEILRAVAAISQHVDAGTIESLRRAEALRQAGLSERLDGLAQLIETRLRLGLLGIPTCPMTTLTAENLRLAARRLLPAERATTLIAADAAAHA
jgi:zinc protease